MFGLACQYDSRQHLLLKPELLRWCKQQTSDEDLKRNLFVYRQMQVGNFVIGQWLNHPRGLFIDVMNLGPSLAGFTREKAQELKHRLLAPITSAQTATRIRQAESDYHHRLQDEAAAAVEATQRRKRDFGY